LGDLAAQADDLDRLVGPDGGGAAGLNRPAVVEQVSVEIGVADAIAGGLHLREVDAEVARAGTHRGGSKDVDTGRFLVGDFGLDAGRGRSRWRRFHRFLDRDDRNLFRLLGRRFDRAIRQRTLVLAVVDRLGGAIGTYGFDHREIGRAHV